MTSGEKAELERSAISSTDPECGPGNGPHCYDHDPACCHCGKPRPEPSTECEGGCRIYTEPPCTPGGTCICGGEWWKHGCKHNLPPEPRCEGCGHTDDEGCGCPPRCTCGCPKGAHMGKPRGCIPHGFHEYEASEEHDFVSPAHCAACMRSWLPPDSVPAAEPPLTPEEEEMVSGRCTCGETACESELCDCDSVPCPVDHAREANEAPEDALPPPEGPEYTPCVCGHIEPEHEVDGYCYDEKCGCVGYRTKPDFETPPQPDRRPPYLVAYSVQGHLYEVALPGDATVAALDGRLVITHHLGPVAGICQIAPITSEES